MKSIQIFILFLLCSIAVKAQITVDNTVTPIDAMQTLLGDNVTISNLNYVGNATQIGVFDCIDCGLDFNNGIIISTGDVATAVGPNDQGGAGTSFVNGPLSNSDLDFISPTPDNYFDIAILEFDFVALGDSVWFEYIWASEEYHFYTVEDGPFDVFGLLISGPDINGAYSDNAENIALVPTTGEGVSNVTINNGQQNTGPCYNCEYLVSNGEGQIGEPQTTDVTVVQYDAYTTGLVASQGNLTCGETYHLKLIIADVQDGIFDSAIILKAGSLSSNLSVGVELQIEATNQEGVMNEECGVSELIFTRPESISTNIPFTVNIVYSGVAVNGVDYSALPEVIVFDPGVDVISFTLDAFEDGIIEGLESVILEMQSVAVCQGESIPSVFEFAITESTPPLVDGYDIDICDGTEIEITPLITGGSGGFLYEWNTTETTSSILVSPGSNTTYSVTLSDTCLVSTGATDINVNVSQFPDIVVNTTPNNIDIDCNWFGEGVSMTASGGDGTYNYAWLDEEGNSLGLGDNTYIFDNSIQAIIAQVTDGCGTIATEEIPVTNDLEPLVVVVPEEVLMCPGEVSIEALITGEGPFFINWTDLSDFSNIGNDAILDLTTSDQMTLQITVSDNCNGFFFQNVDVIISAPEPLEIYAGPDQEGGCLEEMFLTGTVLSGVEPYTYSWVTLDNQNLGNNSLASLELEETEIVILTVFDFCNQETTDSVNIELAIEPLVILLPEILSGDCLNTFEIEATSNYIDDVIYTWGDNDDLYEVTELTATYQSTENAIIEISGDAGCGNTVTVQTEIFIVSEPIQITLVNDTIICFEGVASLAAASTGGTGDLTYTWSGNNLIEEGNPINVSPSYSNLYELEVNDFCGNSASNEVYVEVQHVESLFEVSSLGEETYFFTPDLDSPCADCSYLWEFTDGFESDLESLSHTFNLAGYIGATLTVTTSAGCESIYTDLINVPAIVYIPNAFTPDNDGVNDVWKIEIRGIDDYELRVFNRWGNLVFESFDSEVHWKGEDSFGDYYVPNGVYSYILKYRSLDSQAFTKKGSVTILR